MALNYSGVVQLVARQPLEKALAKSKAFGPLHLSKSIAPLSRP